MTQTSQELYDALPQARQEIQAENIFLERMSHEIRTPMNSIIGLTYLSKENIDNQKQVLENLDKIEKSAYFLRSFIDDIYDVAEMFLSQDDITLIEKKDYIQNPKSNGYRSLHLIIEVPVFLSDRTLNMKVEVQIRTMAMDFWAALEHQANYKKGIDGIDSLVVELTDCANIINQTDRRMQEIYHKIQKVKGSRIVVNGK